MTLDVLYEDNHLLAVGKPAGLPVVPDESGDASLLDLAKDWVRERYDKPGAVFLGVVHRLDRPVSGVVLFARTSKAASRLGDAFRRRAVKKGYVALGHGSPARRSGVLVQWLAKDKATRRSHVVPEGRGKRAETAWRARWTRDDVTFFELEPKTGRSHQLRVAARSLGCPLLGDLKYGAPRPLSDRSIALHAERLELEHPVRREPLELVCPPPARAPWT